MVKIKPVDVKSSTCIENKDKDFKLKIGDHVRIQKSRNIFEKVYTLNWSEAVFEIEKIKSNVPGNM